MLCGSGCGCGGDAATPHPHPAGQGGLPREGRPPSATGWIYSSPHRKGGGGDWGGCHHAVRYYFTIYIKDRVQVRLITMLRRAAEIFAADRCYGRGAPRREVLPGARSAKFWGEIYIYPLILRETLHSAAEP